MLRLAEDHRPAAKVRHRGLFKVDWVFTFACAVYNLVRLRNLSVQPV
jgi:IS5 family transposase